MSSHRVIHRIFMSTFIAALISIAGCSDRPGPATATPAPTTGDEKPASTPAGKQVSTPATKMKTEPVPPPKFNLSTAKPDFSMDVKEWLAEWQDPKAAEEKFNLKIIELSGEVESLRLLKRGDKDLVPCLFLKTGPKVSTRVMVLTQDKEPWARVSPGSKVKVKGTSDGQSVNLMNPCVLVEVGPNPAVATTSANLAAAFAGNKDAAEEKYQDKTVILTGEIAQLEIIDKERFALKLKNDSGVDIVCDFAPIQGDTNDAGILLGKVKNGQRVTVVGQCSMLDDVKLKNCLPITQK